MDEFIDHALGLEPISDEQIREIIQNTNHEPKVEIDIESLQKDLEVARAFVWLSRLHPAPGRQKSFADKVAKHATALATLLMDKEHYGSSISLCENALKRFDLGFHEAYDMVGLILGLLATSSVEMSQHSGGKQGRVPGGSIAYALHTYLIPLFEKHWGCKATATRNTVENRPKPTGPAIRFLVSTVRVIHFHPRSREISTETAAVAVYFEDPPNPLLDEILQTIKNSSHFREVK